MRHGCTPLVFRRRHHGSKTYLNGDEISKYWLNVSRQGKGSKNVWLSHAKRSWKENCFRPCNSRKTSFLRAERVERQITCHWWVEVYGLVAMNEQGTQTSHYRSGTHSTKTCFAHLWPIFWHCIWLEGGHLLPKNIWSWLRPCKTLFDGVLHMQIDAAILVTHLFRISTSAPIEKWIKISVRWVNMN